jgi:hypothetical protein
MSDIGRLLIVIGAVLVLVGLVLTFAGRIPGLGRLPGDLHIQRGNWSFYFPLATSLVLSVVLSIVFWLVGRR